MCLYAVCNCWSWRMVSRITVMTLAPLPFSTLHNQHLYFSLSLFKSVHNHSWILHQRFALYTLSSCPHSTGHAAGIQLTKNFMGSEHSIYVVTSLHCTIWWAKLLIVYSLQSQATAILYNIMLTLSNAVNTVTLTIIPSTLSHPLQCWHSHHAMQLTTLDAVSKPVHYVTEPISFQPVRFQHTPQCMFTHIYIPANQCCGNGNWSL